MIVTVRDALISGVVGKLTSPSLRPPHRLAFLSPNAARSRLKLAARRGLRKTSNGAILDGVSKAGLRGLGLYLGAALTLAACGNASNPGSPASAGSAGSAGAPNTTANGGTAGAPSSAANGGAAGFDLVVGGSGSAAGSASQSAPQNEAELVTQATSAVCDNIASCCSTAGFPFQTARCQTGLAADIGATYALYASPDINFDTASALNCVTQIAAQARQCTFDGPAAIDACNQIFTPTLAAGASCKNSTECAPKGGAYCDTTLASPVCKLATTTADPFAGVAHGKSGDPCFGSCKADQGCGGLLQRPGDLVCWANDGFYCSADRLCVPTEGASGSCTLQEDCSVGLFCSAKVCVAQTASGPCTPGGSECSSTSYCDAVSSHCLAKQAAGTSCTSAPSCTDGYCGVRTRTCASRLALSCQGELY